MATTVSPIKILTDLGLTPWEIENDEDYLRALKEGIIIRPSKEPLTQ